MLNMTSDPNEQTRLIFLDSLRGIAALSVVLFHIHSLTNLALPGSFPLYIEKILSQGYLGVQIFFVLSGFVIAYSIRHSSFTPQFLKHFFIRRSIRLDPPYWIAMILMLTATLLFKIITAKEEAFAFDSVLILSNLFYLHEFFGLGAINPVAWTLCIELQLYMFFVVSLSFLFRWGKVQNPKEITSSTYFPLIFLLLLFFSLEHSQPFLFNRDAPFKIRGFFAPYWYSFFLGCAVCWTLIGWLSKRRLSLFFGLCFFYGIKGMDSRIFTALLFAALILWMGFKGTLRTCILSPALQYLGKISFSLYLIHWLTASNCIFFLSKRIGPLNGFKITGLYLFSLLACILTAHLFYLWVEAPWLRRSRNYGKLPLKQTIQ